MTASTPTGAKQEEQTSSSTGMERKQQPTGQVLQELKEQSISPVEQEEKQQPTLVGPEFGKPVTGQADRKVALELLESN